MFGLYFNFFRGMKRNIEGFECDCPQPREIFSLMGEIRRRLEKDGRRGQQFKLPGQQWRDIVKHIG